MCVLSSGTSAEGGSRLVCGFCSLSFFGRGVELAVSVPIATAINCEQRWLADAVPWLCAPHGMAWLISRGNVGTSTKRWLRQLTKPRTHQRAQGHHLCR